MLDLESSYRDLEPRRMQSGWMSRSGQAAEEERRPRPLLKSELWSLHATYVVKSSCVIAVDVVQFGLS